MSKTVQTPRCARPNMSELGKRANGKVRQKEIRTELRSITLKNQKATLLLAVILAAPAFAVADTVTAPPKGASNSVNFSEGSAREQNLQSSLGTLSNVGSATGARTANLIDFRDNGSKSSSFGRDKAKGRGIHPGDGEGTSAGTGSGTPDPSVAVPEPGSRTLLLVGLAGLWLVFFRRYTLRNAI
jgi:hypothetical protein